MDVYLIRNADGYWLASYRRIDKYQRAGDEELYTCLWCDNVRDAVCFVTQSQAHMFARRIGNCDVIKGVGVYSGVEK